MTDTETAARPEPVADADDLRAELVKTFAEAKAEQSAGPAADVEAVEAAPVTKDGRDERGRFVPKSAKPDTAEKDTQAADAPKADASEPETPAIAAPSTWTAAGKAVWSSLPPQAQQEIARRETEASRKISEQGEQLASWKPIASVISANEQAFRQAGVNPAEGIRLLLEANARLNRDPVGALIELAAGYGVDLGRLGQQQPGADDPRLTFVQRKNAELEARLARFESEREASEQGKRNSLLAEIDQFRAQHEHFDRVQHIMTGLIQAAHAEGKKLTLSDAYDRAVYADPELRAQELDKSQRAAAEAERRKQAEAAAKARSASASVKGAPSGGAAGFEWGNSLAADLKEAARQTRL